MSKLNAGSHVSLLLLPTFSILDDNCDTGLTRSHPCLQHRGLKGKLDLVIDITTEYVNLDVHEFIKEMDDHVQKQTERHGQDAGNSA